jgi:hypothetical protein
MTLRSPIVAMLWELWRVTRTEVAWKLALPIVASMAILALSSSQPELVKDANAAVALVLIVIPHLAGWLSMGKLNNGRPGFPLYLHYTRPVRTAVIVGLPMAYLTAVSSAIYLVSALLLRVTSGYAFPLLPVAAWIAALTVIGVAATWSTRNRVIQVYTMVVATIRAWYVSVERLTAVEIEDNYDWPPRLWPTLFDWPLTDYAWIALIGLACFGVTAAMVTRRRRGDELAASTVAALTWTPVGGWREWLVSQFRFRCPTSSATRAQLWFDLKSNGFPILTIGVALAIAVLMMTAVSGPLDTANLEAMRGSAPCVYGECITLFPVMPVLFAVLSLFIVLVLAGNAFGIRGRQGRTYISGFAATQAYGTAQLAALKVLVTSVCVLAALVAIGISVWISLPLLREAPFIQMWNVRPNSLRSVITDAVAALTGYEQLSLVVVTALGVVIWVAAFALLGALRTRYSRRANIAASSLLLSGLALALLALAARNGIVSPFVVDAIFAAARWIFLAAMVFTIVYVFWIGFAERVLTIRYAGAAVAISAAFGAAWLTVLHITGVQLAAMSALNAISVVSPVLLPLMASALAPWSLSRIRHT